MCIRDMISRVVGSGADARYDVLYDDGDKDEGLREEFVKKEGGGVDVDRGVGGSSGSGGMGGSSGGGGMGGSRGGGSVSMLREGDRVTAKYRGKGKWFAGKISRVVVSYTHLTLPTIYGVDDEVEGVRVENVNKEGGGVDVDRGVGRSSGRGRVGGRQCGGGWGGARGGGWGATLLLGGR